MGILRSVVRTFPPVARRDATIADLKAERLALRQKVDDVRATSAADQERAARDLAAAQRTAEEALARAAAAEKREDTGHRPGTPGRADGKQPSRAGQLPSWRYKLAEVARVRRSVQRLGSRDPVWAVNDKPSGYAFARSYGLEVPTDIASYDDFEDIAWDELPDAFVIKPVNGYASAGVVAVDRRGTKVIDMLNVRRGPIQISDVIRYLNAMNASKRCSREVIIEELMRSPFDENKLAPDLKLYCFHGTVAMIMVRDVNGSRLSEHFTVRFLKPDGADLGEAIVGRSIDPDMPTPPHLDEAVAAGQQLSAAMPTPFVRVDLYERKEGVVFGEVTPNPGGNQNLRPDLDRTFGALWEQAEARLRVEAIESGSLGVRYGDAEGDGAQR